MKLLLCFWRHCGEGKTELWVQRKEAPACINLKNKTSFGESLLWLYIVLHTVSAGGDIYSSLEVCQCRRMLLFLEWLLNPLYVIFHLFFHSGFETNLIWWKRKSQKEVIKISVGEQDMFVSQQFKALHFIFAFWSNPEGTEASVKKNTRSILKH